MINCVNSTIRHVVLMTFFVFSALTSSGSRLSGTIRDDHQQPVPFVNVFIKGTTVGTTANIDGEYVLELRPGSYEVVFRIIGFKQTIEHVEIGDVPLRKDVLLVPESYQLKEVQVVASAEDPAYAIIRKAQGKRKYYQDEVDAFRCNAYVKSTQRLLSYPKKVLGQEVKVEEFVDTATKVFYLSESVSRFAFKKPDKQKEEMISSKVSGNSRTYSFNQASDLMFSFYDNLIQINALVPRGIVSPISGSAMLYYDYKLAGAFVENGELVNKINVIPKRLNDPVFTGDIYIVDSTWRIHSADLYITKNQQIEFIDTFRLRQNYLAVDREHWMPFSNEMNFEFSFMGFHGKGIVLGVFSNYELNPVFPDNYFSGQVMKVEKEANKKDSLYWNTARPIPLTGMEELDYHRKDSTRLIYESKPYRDSIDKVNNKFKYNILLNGYTWQNSFRHEFFSISPLIQDVLFNTVEGLATQLLFRYDKDFGDEDRRKYFIEPELRYGFANEHFNGHVKANYFYNAHQLSSVQADIGTDVVQFNSNDPISPLANTLYSLLARKNFMKMYEKQFVKVSHKMEIANGIEFGVRAEYARRLPLVNSSFFSFYARSKRDYLSNDPLISSTDSLHFPENEAALVELNFRIRFHQTYIDRPEGKFITGNEYPTLRIKYTKGLPVAGSDVDFDKFQVSLEDELKLGLLGRLEYMVTYGDFLRTKKAYFMDFKHFNGNQTWFSGFQLNSYKNLDYYNFSTTGSYVEAHAEQNFGGFILNKIPFVRKLKLTEVAGVHYLHTKALENYMDISAGIQKLGAFRVEIYTSFENGHRGTFGILFGIKQNIGLQ